MLSRQTLWRAEDIMEAPSESARVRPSTTLPGHCPAPPLPRMLSSHRFDSSPGGRLERRVLRGNIQGACAGGCRQRKRVDQP